MSARSSAVWLTVLAVLVVVVTWLARQRVPERAATKGVSQTTGGAGPHDELPKRDRAGSPGPVAATDVARAPRERKEQRMAEILSSENDVPIVFYGKLEDQFGAPVVGATISGNTLIYNGTIAGGQHVSVRSDSRGAFEIRAGKGESLGLMPTKAGYALAATTTEFKFSHLFEGYYVADLNNPTVIKMWKLQGAEPLVSVGKQYRLRYDHAPLSFDLIAGEIVPSGGDLKIVVRRDTGTISSGNKLSWGVRVEAVEGGIMDSSGQEAVTYWAPLEGYGDGQDFFFSTNAPHRWAESFSHGFFIRSRNGRVFTKLGFTFKINYRPDDLIYVGLGGVANTNGSRNWEGDPGTMAHAQ